METLATLFVGKPLNILVVAAALLLVYFGLARTSFGAGRRTGALLVAAVAWAVYAGWEWLVQARTPEADIRVDLLLIWPLLGVLTLWAAVRAALRPKLVVPRA